MSQLHLLADTTTFWFAPPPGEPLDLERFGERKRVALQSLLSQRFPLSEDLREKIRKHEAQKTKRALICLCCLNLCLPGVPNTSTFDYDRDMATLAQSAKAVLAAILGPGWYELAEHIDAVGSFGSGKTLFALYLS